MAVSPSLIVAVTLAVFLEVQWKSTLFTEGNRLYYEDDLKYILFWPVTGALNKQPPGTIGFESCPVKNCFLSHDKDLFGGNLQRFDAIAFTNWCNFDKVRYIDLPSTRYDHQLYIYFSLESHENCPVCHRRYDKFFNWTMTYRFDSDTPIFYFTILNRATEVVGPREDMHWETDYINYNFTTDVRKKTKAAAWFVTNCHDRSGRLKFARRLQAALHRYGLKLDIYGKCGTFKCPKEQHLECLKKLKREYYFYLALENTFAEDYVSEKILHAVQNDVVPIVYGGADYSRFLPPGSYLDGRKLGPNKLAAKMYRLIEHPYLYQQYFRWKDYYSYKLGDVQVGCKICAVLNQQIQKPRVIKHFRRWWDPQFVNSCM